jgi:hypothetical protein
MLTGPNSMAYFGERAMNAPMPRHISISGAKSRWYCAVTNERPSSIAGSSARSRASPYLNSDCVYRPRLP